MDGYAVLADDVAAATPENPVQLPVAEDIPAGRTDPLTLKPGTAHRIMTGAPVPAGATAVVPVESTDAGTGHRRDPRDRQRPASTSAAPVRTSPRAPPCCERVRSSRRPRWAWRPRSGLAS